MLGVKASDVSAFNIDEIKKNINRDEEQSSDETTSSLSTILAPSGNDFVFESDHSYNSSNEHGEISKPKLVRKKSGQLVKSSLKLPSLTKSLSATSLSPGKSVRFAARLANVKMFDGTESPSTVSTADNTPISSPHGIHEDDRFSYFDIDFEKDEISDITSDTSSEDDQTGYGYSSEIRNIHKDINSDVKYEIERKDFVEPKSIYDRLDSICYLQYLQMSADRKDLIGYIMVKNIAYEKNLSVKLTSNNWKSTIIINNATYINSFPSIDYDRFRFTVSLSTFPKWVSMEFAIKYSVGDQVFWDNNQSKNYHIVLKPYTAPHPIGNEFKLDSISSFDGWMRNLTHNYIDDLDIDVDSLKPGKPKSEFHQRYNINNNWNMESKTDSELVEPSLRFGFKKLERDNDDSQTLASDSTVENITSLSPVSPVTVTRPPLKANYSYSDVLNVKPRYSKAHRSKNTTPVAEVQIPDDDLSSAKFKSKSYTQLVQSYCFSNGKINLDLSPKLDNTSPMLEPNTYGLTNTGDSIYI